MPTYKSYCWSLGTTSFRMVEFNRKIEKQLEFLRDFWANPAFSNQPWSENEPVQIAYYEFLKGNGFIEERLHEKQKTQEKRRPVLWISAL